jgi:uncharacterized membrane protein YedE/YeeE
MNIWPLIGLGGLLFGLGYVVGFVRGYESWVMQERRANGEGPKR